MGMKEAWHWSWTTWHWATKFIVPTRTRVCTGMHTCLAIAFPGSPGWERLSSFSSHSKERSPSLTTISQFDSPKKGTVLHIQKQGCSRSLVTLAAGMNLGKIHGYTFMGQRVMHLRPRPPPPILEVYLLEPDKGPLHKSQVHSPL